MTDYASFIQTKTQAGADDGNQFDVQTGDLFADAEAE